MRAQALLRPLLSYAFVLLTLGLALPCAQGATPAPDAVALNTDAPQCPRSLFLETVTVRVFETSDTAESMLHSACLEASQKALAAWRTAALKNKSPSIRACAVQMGAQGCLMGQPFTQPHCTDIVCPLTQKCTVTLVHLGARTKVR